MSNGIEPIQNKFLKLIWLLTAKDWTSELIIVGVIILAVVSGDKQVVGNVVSGLIGFMAKGGVDALEKVGDKL